MTKFFRKIRQNLLLEGKTEMYLKYVIGEIVLVVIGILIALQINNWNEDRKQQSKIKSVYSVIKSDLKYDVEKFDKIIKSMSIVDISLLVIKM
ncbi:MAG: sensor domain CHASE-containing protein [Gammaproteobacteria bacterium]|jgi:sensor domain CHASE-containing protein